MMDITQIDKRVLDRIGQVEVLSDCSVRVIYEPMGDEAYYGSTEEFFNACKEEERILREDDLAEKVAKKVVKMLKREETRQ